MRLPIEDHERLAKLASAAQAIVVTLAVVIGGIWTAWTFSTLQTTEKARKDLEKTKLDLEVQSLRRPVLDLTIGVEVLESVKNISEVFPKRLAQILPNSRPYVPKRVVHVVVSVKNSGNQDAKLDIAKDTLFIRRLRSAIGGRGEGFQPGGTGYTVRGIDNYPKSINVLSGNRQELHYIAEVEEDSIYQFEFSVPAQSAGTGQDNFDVQAGTRMRPGVSTWSAATYKVIPKAASHR